MMFKFNNSGMAKLKKFASKKDMAILDMRNAMISIPKEITDGCHTELILYGFNLSQAKAMDNRRWCIFPAHFLTAEMTVLPNDGEIGFKHEAYLTGKLYTHCEEGIWNPDTDFHFMCDEDKAANTLRIHRHIIEPCFTRPVFHTSTDLKTQAVQQRWINEVTSRTDRLFQSKEPLFKTLRGTGEGKGDVTITQSISDAYSLHLYARISKKLMLTDSE